MAGPVALVAVDGIDGSGKSTLANQLLVQLDAGGARAALLRVDDFRRAVDWSRADRSELDLYYDDYYDLARLDACLVAAAAGAGAVEVPIWDAARERVRAGETRRLPLAGAGVVLVEGVFVQRLPAVARAAAIYVQTTPAEARRRILARDVARGRAAAEVERRIATRYFPAQRRYEATCDPIARAAAVVDNEAPGAPRALRLDAGRLPAPVAQALEAILNR